MEKIDPEQLIGLVQSRPLIWDKSLDTHKDFVLRASSWREICKALNSEFDNLPRKEKNIYVKGVMKKWTNIRDAWRKTMADDDKPKFKPYVHHEQLLFLLKNLHYKQGGRSKDKTAEDSDDPPTGLPSRAAKRSKPYGEDERETSLMPFMEVKTVQSEDAHISFFKSLLPSLQKLDDDETLEFQVGVIKLLQQLRQKSKGIENEAYACYSVPSSSYGVCDIKEDLE